VGKIVGWVNGKAKALPYLFESARVGCDGKLEADMRLALGKSALILILVASGGLCLAQETPADLHGLKIKPIVGPPTPTPFPLDLHTGRYDTLEFRAQEAMTEPDRLLAASAESEIARRAELQGFKLGDDTGWGYEQAVCPVFPDHLILEYSRINGAGDVTLFSAVVPRGSEGHVRVIPVRRRSYSLFTPSSSNSLTINDFNHMVKEEPTGLSVDWLRLSLCYAALAGGHVRASLIAAVPADEQYPMYAPAKLAVSRKGGALVTFVDTKAAGPKAKGGWEMEFAQNGRLLKVKRSDPRGLVVVPMRESVIEAGGEPSK